MVGAGRLDGRQTGHQMVPDRVAIGQDLARRPPRRQTPRRALFVGHRHGAQIPRPAVAVPGIEGVVDLAVEVGDALFVEAAGGVPADQLAALQRRGGDPGVQRLGLGREEEGLVGAHLVGVHHDLGPPVADLGRMAARLGLGLDEPVAVEVEQVVVEAPAGPGLVPLGRQGIGVGRRAVTRRVGVEEALAPVGVLGRHEDHDGVGHPAAHGRIARGQQVSRCCHGGVGGADLVAVNRIGQPDDHRLVGDDGAGLGGRGAARIGQGAGVGLDLVQPGDVGRRSDGGPEHGTSLVGAGLFADHHPVGRGGPQGLEIAQDVGRARDPLAAVVAQHRLHRGDRRVIVRARDQRRGDRRLGPARRGDGKGRQGERQDGGQKAAERHRSSPEIRPPV